MICQYLKIWMNDANKGLEREALEELQGIAYGGQIEVPFLDRDVLACTSCLTVEEAVLGRQKTGASASSSHWVSRMTILG
jgi:hypothetical protein